MRAPGYVNMPEAAALLGVSRQTVHRLIQRGELARVKDGYFVRIALGELDRFIASRSQPARRTQE